MKAGSGPGSTRRAAGHTNHAGAHYRAVDVEVEGQAIKLRSGSVVIAAITSCTNTSNPSVMVAAGLLARNAVGTWPLDAAVGQDLAGAGLARSDRLPGRCGPDGAARGARLRPGRLRLHDLHRQLRAAGRIDRGRDRGQRPGGRGGALGQPQLRGTHPPAARGPATSPRRHWSSPSRSPGASTSTSPRSRWGPIATASPSSWPSCGRPTRRVASSGGRAGAVRRSSPATTHRSSMATSDGATCPSRRGTATPGIRPAPTWRCRPSSTGLTAEPPALTDVVGARVLAMLGDSVTTDHISPAGSIARDITGGGVAGGARRRAARVQQYGARRGHHEVMVRGTFANIRLRNC